MCRRSVAGIGEEEDKEQQLQVERVLQRGMELEL